MAIKLKTTAIITFLFVCSVFSGQGYAEENLSEMVLQDSDLRAGFCLYIGSDKGVSAAE
jgi:hypothetical protein